MPKPSKSVKESVKELEKVRDRLARECDLLDKQIKERLKELESLTVPDLEKPPSPALKPCQMICKILNCPFQIHCWYPEKLEPKEEEPVETTESKMEVKT